MLLGLKPNNECSTKELEEKKRAKERKVLVINKVKKETPKSSVKIFLDAVDIFMPN